MAEREGGGELGEGGREVEEKEDRERFMVSFSSVGLFFSFREEGEGKEEETEAIIGVVYSLF